MMRDPGDFTLRPRPQPPPAARARMARALAAILCLIGVLMTGLVLGVFLTQGSQIKVRASVLSERCHPQLDLATGQTETRCDAQVQYTAVNGQVIRTTITGAFPYEFSGTGHSRTIALRYDSNDPAQPFKQSNYMPTDTFLVMLILGAAMILFAGWIFYKSRPTSGPQGNPIQSSDLSPG